MIETGAEEQIASFYDALADDYDLMTDFSSRLSAEEQILKTLVTKYPIHTAIDAGAGTGLHSLALVRLGVRVTAVDISAFMLNHLNRNAEEAGVTVETVQAPLEELARATTGDVEAVLCLGNTISHIQRDNLQEVLSSFSQVIRPDGILVLQLLNYEKILRV